MLVSAAMLLSTSASLLSFMVLAPPGQGLAAAATNSVPEAKCEAGSLPETEQGRVSRADIDSGRAAEGYRCNASLLSHVSGTGSYKLQRYVDNHGRQCAYYDDARALPPNGTAAEGTRVVDMTDPANPVATATLRSPAMLSPHESLLVNQQRGLLVAAMGSRSTAPAVVDVYRLDEDCRYPVLASSTPISTLGHESAFAPDGRTFYIASSVAPTVTAVQLDDPAAPQVVGVIAGRNVHGMSVSDDGTRLYAAESFPSEGLTIFDVSQVQDRAAVPVVTELSHLAWPNGSPPLTTMPFTVRGRPYLMEVDEYTALLPLAGPDLRKVGGVRIIDISDEKRPVVVSDIRLRVHLASNRELNGPVMQDPGATNPAGGYSSHYCSLPRRDDPGIMACGMVKSGLRVFDLRNPQRPTEVAYFNQPPANGTSDVVSTVAFDPANRALWYTDGATGLWAVRVSQSVWQPEGDYPNTSG